MSKSESSTSAESLNFEQSLARLEALVKEMESGTLSLDRMIQCFEEGTRLAALCDQKLNEVEKKVELLIKEGGRTTTTPFDPNKEAGSS
jgi:exodeoxyribonuclease VII small subunit